MKTLKRFPRLNDMIEGKSVNRYIPGKGIFEFAKLNGGLYKRMWERASSEVVNIKDYVDSLWKRSGTSVYKATGKVAIGSISPKSKLTIVGAITLKEQASADTDTAAYGQIWVKNDAPNSLYFTDDAGNDEKIANTTELATYLPLAGGTMSGAIAMGGQNITGGGTAAFTDITATGAFTSQGIDDNADAIAITIDSSERVGIGTGSTALDQEFTVAIGSSSPVMNVDAYSTTNGHYGYIQCRKSDNNTVGTLTQTDSGDYLGGVATWGVGTGGSPGRAYGSYFAVLQTGTSGVSVIPSKFQIRTTTNSGLNNALTAGDDGVVDIETGLKVAGSTVTANNILDEDAMGSNSATALATQQSIKAYTDTMLPLAGGTMTGDLILSGTGTDIVLTATAKLRLDGSASGDSYIYEHGADSVRIFVGGDEMLRLTEGGTTGNEIFVKEGCFTFTQITEAFSVDVLADEGSGTGGANDTDIDFRHTNKIKLAVTGIMNDMNLIFPAGSGNFQLLVTYSGDYSIDSWKAWTKTAQEASIANVLWPGGTEPDPTASGVDIFSFFWDVETETAYGVASLNFVAGD